MPDNAKTNPHAGHRERVRQEFLRHGIDEKTPPHKVMELLLFYCVSRTDTNPLAHELIKKYKTVAGVLDAPFEELAGFKGLSERGATLLKMIMPIARIYLANKESHTPEFKTLDDLGTYIFKKYIGVQNERIGALLLDFKGRIIGFDFIAEGDIASAGLPFRNVIKYALSNNAASVVLAHNHPNGLALPSSSDIKTTEKLQKALAGTGVRLCDHLIIADNDFVSMAQSNEFVYIFGTNYHAEPELESEPDIAAVAQF